MREYIDRIWPHVAGESRSRECLLLAVIALLVLFSGGFLLELLDVGFSLGWIGVAFGIATVAGMVRAGLGPTVGALWLFALWWYVFPPLVGYLTGNWEMASRYTYPRMLGYGYTAAYYELIGGIERGVTSGLLFAIFVGTVGYTVGTAFSWYLIRPTAR